MRSSISLLMIACALWPAVPARTSAQAASGAAVYAVSYVETLPSARAGVLAAFTAYREASRKDDGFVRLELFEQVGRPGHFAIIETWKDQRALDTHAAAPHGQQLRARLEPIRSSDYDLRPYKLISAGVPLEKSGSAAIHVITHVDTAPAPTPADGNDGPRVLMRLAEASHKEEGNLRFDVLQHTMRGNHFTVVETWQNQAALDRHAAAAHTRQYRDGLAPLLGSPLDERLYKSVE